jgi:membrane-bound inhibitor of C-type lysozyme
MQMQAKWKLMITTVLGCGTALAGATDLTIHLNGAQPLSRKTVQYQCDAHTAAIGLPAAAFPAEYINGAGNSLVIVPVHGTSLIFANVNSASGARYAAGQYIWWEAGGAVTFYSDSLVGKMQSACHPLPSK